LLHQPDTHWAQILAHTALDGVNTTTNLEHPLLLDRHTRLVILAQGRDLDAALCSIVGVEHCTGVAGVCAVDGVAVEEDSHAGRPTQLGIVVLLGQVRVHLMEGLVELPWHSVVHLSEAAVALVQFVGGKLLLHIKGKMLFNIGADMVTVHAVAIADGEEVQTQLAQHVGYEHVGVLVWLVWIARLVAD